MWLVATGKVAGNLPFRLQRGDLLVGRARMADIVLLDAAVSRRHAKLTVGHNTLVLHDLGSSNGTLVNGLRVGTCGLHIGDQVRFGGVGCIVSASPLAFSWHADDDPTLKISQDANGQTARIDVLTAAQQEVLDHLLAGHSEAEIAAQLGKSHHTVHTHLKRIYERLDVHSRAELMARFLKGEC